MPTLLTDVNRCLWMIGAPGYTVNCCGLSVVLLTSSLRLNEVP